MNNGEVVIILSLTLSIVAILLTVIAIPVSVISLIKVIAMEKSTHSIQYVPIDPEIEKANQEFMKKGESWATQESSVQKDYKLYKEELEDVMPEFFEDDAITKVKISL